MNKLIIILLIASFGAYAQVSSGVAKITEVKLFRNMAELNHEVELNIKRGANDYYIDSIAKTIDISTFLLNSDESLRILSTNYFGNEMDSALYNKIKDSIEITDIEINKAKKIYDVNNLQKNLYSNYPAKLASKNNKISPLELNQISKEVKSKLKEINIKFAKSEKILDSLNSYRSELIKILNSITTKRNFLKIRIYSEKDFKSKHTFSYIAYKAGWDLAYDMFLNEYEDKARLESKAIINQTTGLDWTNTKLQIINSKPDKFKYLDLNANVLDNSNNAKYPGLEAPYYSIDLTKSNFKSLQNINEITTLSAGVRKSGNGYTVRGARDSQTKMRIDGVDINDPFSGGLGSETTNSFVNVSGGGFSDKIEVDDVSNIPIDDRFNSNINYVTKEEINDEKFAIEDRVDIPNGTSGKIVRFESRMILVEVFAKAVPIISKNTYLIVEVPNFKKYNMEGVTISKYHNGIFKGNGILALPRPNIGQLNFGIEKNIIVERRTLRDYINSKIFSSRKTTEFEYEFNVKNNYSDRLNLRIDDRVPVIKDDSYELEMLDLIGWEKDSYGIVTWKVNLEPNEQITKKLKFNVTHPGNAVIRK